MSRKTAVGRVAPTALVSAAIGPGLAGLYEMGAFPFATATLWSLVWIVLGSAHGVIAGVWIARERSPMIGGIVVTPNLVALLLYGFLLLFFGTGGSR